MIRRTLVKGAALLAALFGAAIDSRAFAETIAVTGGTIHDMKNTAPYTGTVLIEGSRIRAVGPDVSVPQGARIIDAQGLHVYPGIVDASSVLGLTEIGSVRATVDTREIGEINPNARAETSINPDSELLPVARVAGITSAIITPQGGTIAGTSALVHLDGWTWEDMTVKSPVALVVTWPSRPAWSPWSETDNRADLDKERDKKITALKDAFANARAYVKARSAEGQPGVPRHDREPKWEAMVPALEGKIPVVVKVRWADDIEAAVKWGDEEKLRLVLLGAEEAYKVTGLLKDRNIPVVLDKVTDFPQRRYEPYDSHYTLASKLHAAGIRFAFCMDTSASDSRNLPYNAAMAAAFGLPESEALKAIFSNGPEIFGLADQVGTLSAGLYADLMVTDGSPLEIRTQVKHVFIAGREIPLESRHTRLNDKYESRPRPASAAGSAPESSVGSAHH
jgi:imidazolonepropionase-like amidohydrolase